MLSNVVISRFKIVGGVVAALLCLPSSAAPLSTLNLLRGSQQSMHFASDIASARVTGEPIVEFKIQGEQLSLRAIHIGVTELELVLESAAAPLSFEILVEESRLPEIQVQQPVIPARPLPEGIVQEDQEEPKTLGDDELQQLPVEVSSEPAPLKPPEPAESLPGLVGTADSAASRVAESSVEIMEVAVIGSGTADTAGPADSAEPMAEVAETDVSALMLAEPLPEPAEIAPSSAVALLPLQESWLDSLAPEFDRPHDPGSRPSLSEVVERGLRLNPEVQAETALVAQMLTEVKISESGYWPSLELSAGPENGLSGELGYDVFLSQMLFDWGRTSSDVSAANAKHRKQAQTLLMTRNDAALEIIEVCLDLLSASAQMDSIERYQEQLASLFQLVKQRTEVGYGTNAELGRIQQAQGYMHEQLISVRSRLREAENEYRLLTSYSAKDIPDFETDFGLIDELLTGKSLERAIQRSPQYMAAQEDLLLAQAQVDGVEASLKPRVVLEASAQRREVGGIMTDDSTVALRLRMDPIQGLSSFQRTVSERQGLEAAQWQLSAVRRTLQRGAESARENILALGQRVQSLTQQLGYLDTIRESYRQQFVAGSRTIDDLISIEREQYELEVQTITTRHEYLRVPYRTTADLGLLTHLVVGQLKESLRP